MEHTDLKKETFSFRLDGLPMHQAYDTLHLVFGRKRFNIQTGTI